MVYGYRNEKAADKITQNKYFRDEFNEASINLEIIQNRVKKILEKQSTFLIMYLTDFQITDSSDILQIEGKVIYKKSFKRAKLLFD